jgi:XTP/dITP diphosphohydrolase
MSLVEQRLDERDETDFSAAFVCALAVAWPKGPAVVAEGRVEGALTFPPRGTLGFGYDPIFTPQGGSKTFGEMAPQDKDAISHRARAFAQIKASLL